MPWWDASKISQRLHGFRRWFLIFHSKPTWLAAELAATALRDDSGQHLRLPVAVDLLSEATLTHVLSLDRAQFFDFNGNLVLASQHVAPAPEPGEPREGGTKRSTARRVARRFRDAIVTAISQDGPITTFCDGVRYKTNQKPKRYFEHPSSWT
jgi:hypothetical protein